MAKPAQKDTFRRYLILTAICLSAGLFFGLLGLIQFKPLIEAELYTCDLRIRFGQPAPISHEIVFIAIDSPTYKDILSEKEIAANPTLAEMSTGSWPWHRSVWASVIQRITDAGAKVVGLDVLFPTAKGGDAELLKIMTARGDHAVLGGTFEEVSNAGRTSVQLTLPAALASFGASEISKENAAGRVGYVNFWPDSDGTVRRADYHRQFQNVTSVSLSYRMLEKAGYGNRIPESGSGLLRFAGPPNFNYKSIPVYQLFVPSTWKTVFQNGEMLKDKIVLVGPYGNWSKDVIRTPYPTAMPGPEVHLAALGAALTGGFLFSPPTWTPPAMLLAAALLALLLICATSHPAFRLILLAALEVGYAVLTFFIQNRFNLILPAVSPSLTLLFGGIGCLGYEFVLEQRAKRRVSGMFSTMVSPEVLSYMQEDPDRFRLTGEKRMVTIFFSDLAGFTTISESVSAEDLAKILNHYLTPMSDLVTKYGGYIDKYSGDAIMADFGVPVWTDPDTDSHAWKACWSALEQQERLQSLKQELKAEYGCDIDARMGINTGEVAAGNMGSDKKFQYTVMGDAVNQAARFEPANKPFDTHIMIGGKTYEMAKDKIEARFLAAMIVKGKTEAVPCYELLAKKGELSEAKRRVVQIFEEGWKLHAAKKFQEAIAKFEEALSLDSHDGPSKTYKKICQGFLRTPPPDAWAGEYIQTSK
ncbi:MAG: adenylate/guanylate cyclase domain-containing protein [Verrucomicrobia bacterium]|nr:adenylate/guanylate cyclase domain-containing protein [Verrucomicrobiota bacterium]